MATQNTQKQIVDYGHYLLRNQGYAGLNYSAISEKLGIKNAAIHYHFKKKEDLVVAIIETETKLMSERETEPPGKQLNQWFDLCVKEYETQLCVCLVGSLVGDLDRLPERVRQAVDAFGMALYFWMVAVLEAGKKDNTFVFDDTPEAKALTVLSTMQGARQIARMTSVETLKGVIRQIKDSLQNLS